MKNFTVDQLRCYDNGGRSFDRYTVIPPRWAGKDWQERPRLWVAIGASERPFHPQGFGQMCSAQAGRHLGKRVAFKELPGDVQRFARQVFTETQEGAKNENV